MKRHLPFLSFFLIIIFTSAFLKPGAAVAQIGIRSFDGSGNNVGNPTWGQAGTVFRRDYEDPAYEDGLSAPARSTVTDPNPRTISNTVADQDQSTYDSRGLSDFVWQWGQFLDHDITLGKLGSETLPIDIPDTTPSDPLEPFIPFRRTEYVNDTDGVRQQMNSQSSYIDGSMVYGAESGRAGDLRESAGGRLLMTSEFLLPTAREFSQLEDLENANDTGELDALDLFVAGDIRANEQVGLATMHTLFVREHNRLATEIEAADTTGMSDSDIYEKARSINIGQIQNITYSEFLPALMGSGAPGAAGTYVSTKNASISNEFATAFFRLGHTIVSPELQLVNNSGASEGSLPLHSIFFNAPHYLVEEEDIDLVLKGLSTQFQQKLDTLIIDDLRNSLFGAPGSGGLDLASLNIQRGREHGLPDYNTMRGYFGLDELTDFSQITSDVDLAMALQTVYDDDINAIDPWIGALAEDHLAGSSVGALLDAALADQFERLRDGDRFFFTRDPNLSSAEIALIESRTLADIIRDNTGLTNIQDNVFVVPEPSRAVLLVLGGLGLIARRRR